MRLLRDKATGLWMRPGTTDREVIREQRIYSPMELTGDDVVLDLGGHIGSFACLAVPQGCSVKSYEPEPDNIAVMRRQREGGLGPDEWQICRAAVAMAEGQADFFVNDRRNKGAHTLRPTRGRRKVTVATASWTGSALRPVWKRPITAIKCDIEGGEYSLDWSSVPATVRVIAMELHLQPKGWRDKARRLYDQFVGDDWEAVVEPKGLGEGQGHWHTVTILRRAT